MPIEHQPGAITTFRNVPQATRDAIGSLSMLMKQTAGDVIADAIASHVEKLTRERRLPVKWDRAVERQALLGLKERATTLSDRRRCATGPTSLISPARTVRESPEV